MHGLVKFKQEFHFIDWKLEFLFYVLGKFHTVIIYFLQKPALQDLSSGCWKDRDTKCYAYRYTHV
jgi:hypothetical protein